MFYSIFFATLLSSAAAVPGYGPPPSYAPSPTSSSQGYVPSQVSSSTTLSLPTSSPTAFPDSSVFWVMSLRSASPIHFSHVSAASSSLFLNLVNDNATCDSDQGSYAFLSIKDTELYLYTGSDAPQKIFVDRSGMGQGKIGYVTGVNATLGKNWETKGWKIDEWPNETFNGSLSFDGTSLQACPGSIDGSWSVWLALVKNPGSNEGCLGFTAAVTEVEEPVACQYTQ